jgi:hypothetical protein
MLFFDKIRMKLIRFAFAHAKLIHFGLYFINILIFLPFDVVLLHHIRQLQGRIIDIDQKGNHHCHFLLRLHRKIHVFRQHSIEFVLISSQIVPLNPVQLSLQLKVLEKDGFFLKLVD